jgi:hypothetical protein
VAEVLRASSVQATFFLASERTPDRRLEPGRRLGAVVARARRRRPRLRLAHLGPRRLAGRDHADGRARFEAPPRGRRPGRAARTLGAGALLRGAATARRERFEAMTGQRHGAADLPRPGRAHLGGACWRLPGAAATAHVGWAPAGFLGDELPSERYPNARAAGAARCARSGPATSWWRTWASGRAATRGRRRCWSRCIDRVEGSAGCALRTLREHPSARPVARPAAGSEA